MTFDPERLRQELHASGALLVKALRDVSPTIATRRPEAGKWSPLEIAAHLLDEERLDFRARTRSTLEDPMRACDPIDPEGWVVARSYSTRDFHETIEAFEDERGHSLAWLASVRDADWSRAHDHPRLGPIAAGELLSSWAAHDLLHVAQLARTRVLLLDVTVAPYTTRYARP